MIKLFLTLTTLIVTSAASAATINSDAEVIKKLSAFKVADVLEDSTRLRKKQPLKIDEMFDELENASVFYRTANPSEEAAYELARVSLITFLHDPQTYSADLILSTYEKNTDLFKRAVKKLHPDDQKVILQVLDEKSRFFKDNKG